MFKTQCFSRNIYASWFNQFVSVVERHYVQFVKGCVTIGFMIKIQFTSKNVVYCFFCVTEVVDSWKLFLLFADLWFSLYRKLYLSNLGKTPVLDIGAPARIRSRDIKVVPGIKKFLQGGVELVNGEILALDYVIFATGYTSNVPTWLKESEFFAKDGFPRSPFPNGWKGRDGLYAVGFTRRGLSGASTDAVKVAQDIGEICNQEIKQNTNAVGVACNRRCKP